MLTPTQWFLRATITAGVFIAALRPSYAQEEEPTGGFSHTELQFLSRFGPFNLDADGNFLFTVEHFSTWEYGSNFFFIDVDAGAFDAWRKSAGLYLEYAPALSVSPWLGLSPGILKDISLTPQLNLGRTATGMAINTAFLAGLQLTWNVTGLLQTQFLLRAQYDAELSGQITLVWSFPFALGVVSAQFRGFLDLWRSRPSTGDAETNWILLAQPQLLISLAGIGLSGLDVGVEVQVSHDFPTRALYSKSRFDFAVAPMARWVF